MGKTLAESKIEEGFDMCLGALLSNHEPDYKNLAELLAEGEWLVQALEAEIYDETGWPTLDEIYEDVRANLYEYLDAFEEESNGDYRIADEEELADLRDEEGGIYRIARAYEIAFEWALRERIDVEREKLGVKIKH